uniref:C-type lectin domain-containing protein n=1 Tax=Myripristis murdjan TaxID=586833 RepID=A0A667WP61_9TELE
KYHLCHQHLGLLISSSHLSDEFHFVNLKMSWSEAQRYCRVKHTDLATKTSWRWSATGNTSRTTFHNWKPPEPNNRGGNQLCVLISVFIHLTKMYSLVSIQYRIWCIINK